MNKESRRLIVATYDLRPRTDGDDLVEAGLRERFPVSHLGAGSFTLAEQAADDDGQGLRLPVYVQDDAAAGVGADAWVGERFPGADDAVVGNLSG